jgi:hypothetical protein
MYQWSPDLKGPSRLNHLQDLSHAPMQHCGLKWASIVSRSRRHTYPENSGVCIVRSFKTPGFHGEDPPIYNFSDVIVNARRNQGREGWTLEKIARKIIQFPGRVNSTSNNYPMNGQSIRFRFFESYLLALITYLK